MSSYSREAGRDPVYARLKHDFKVHYSFCRICRKYVKFKYRTVDHIIPMWQYEGSPYDVANWQMICDECHAIKTKLEGQPNV